MAKPILSCHLYYYDFVLCVFLCAKPKKNVSKRSVVLNDYVLDVVLIILFPIGIWFLQPRVNKLLIGS